MITTTKKFRPRDQKTLYTTLQKVIQIKYEIEAQTIEKQSHPAEMPQSLLPTDVLYDIASCFEAMYDKLLAKELLEAGYPKQDQNILH